MLVFAFVFFFFSSRYLELNTTTALVHSLLALGVLGGGCSHEELVGVGA